jgi:uncharacterized protein (DUF983 family)
MKKRATVSAILHSKCPKCHEGNLFIEKNPFKLKMISQMPVVCPVCNLNFNSEPGFYWGALYVSYGLSVLLSLILFAAMYLRWGWLIWQFLVTDALLLIFLAPVLLRFSRVLWIYICYKFFPGKWRN